MPHRATRLPHIKILWQRAWRYRSAGLGFSLAYGFVFAISAAVFLTFLWWNTTGTLAREVGQAVEADAKSLTDRLDQNGVPALIQAIQDRLDQDVEDESLYLLMAPDGTRLAGNLHAWPKPVRNDERFYIIKISRDGRTASAQLHAYRLPNNLHLLIGRDVRGRDMLRRVLTETFLWSWVMVTALAIGGGLVVRGIFSRILTSIAQTTAAIAHGDMRQRMPMVGNEVDLVAQTVNKMLDRITRLMEGVKQVSNSIAHDLRTPITRARNRLEDASLHAKTNEEMHDAIDRAVADLDHITSVFDALMRIAQIEAGARRAAFETGDLVKPLHDIAELYEATAEDAGLHLAQDLPPRLMFYGDSRLIQQGVANLIDNAIKFSPPDTTITLRASLSGDLVRISVTDQGAGMAQEDLARASERFFRADQARNTPGAGLGLSLVQAVAQLHGGTFSLEPLQRGLRAVISLPSNSNEKPPAPQQITGASPSAHDADI
ncbi:sensor histidine kinase [Kozakia baliensis]|uniref:sensor histidine kinase n=1 Tax=Kozakia baliensis TaxID=153496 RepID=UPI0009E06D58|nr:HAMP domain-containing sensor histidine kinase [Kozakia baliensis]